MNKTSFTKLGLWFHGAQPATSTGKRPRSKGYIVVGHDATLKSTDCQRSLLMMVLPDDGSRQERLQETHDLVRTTCGCHISGAGAAQASTSRGGFPHTPRVVWQNGCERCPALIVCVVLAGIFSHDFL